MSQKYKVNALGHLGRVCQIGNIEAKKCINCEHAGSVPTFMGEPRGIIICCYSGLEGRNLNYRYFEKRFPKVK